MDSIVLMDQRAVVYVVLLAHKNVDELFFCEIENWYIGMFLTNINLIIRKSYPFSEPEIIILK